jgi:hypothetical protein
MVDITTGSGSGSPGSSSGSGGDTGAGGAVDPGDIDYPDDIDFDYDPREGQGGGCGNVVGEAGSVSRPIDIIISIDNSGSMEGEIAAVQQRIDEDFSEILEDSNIDYRVIMVTRFGNLNEGGPLPGDVNFPVCIGAPLGGASQTCNAGQTTVAPNAPIFYHHSTDIGSRNMWCRLTQSFNSEDEVPSNTERNNWNAVAPDGWQEWLRDGSFKVFVGITDDAPAASGTTIGNNNCPAATNFTDNLSGAQAFDQAIRALSPDHFGAYDAGDPDENRNYAWYSIVGMEGNDADDPTPLEPDDPVNNTVCDRPGGDSNDDGVRAGVGYQELSRMTGGLRYPSCFNDNFNDIFSAIAQGVIDSSVVPCQFEIPDVDGIINVQNITAVYQPGGGGTPRTFTHADDVDDCDGEQFYLDSNTNPTQLFLCPDACTLVQADVQAEINIDFGCLGS